MTSSCLKRLREETGDPNKSMSSRNASKMNPATTTAAAYVIGNRSSFSSGVLHYKNFKLRSAGANPLKICNKTFVDYHILTYRTSTTLGTSCFESWHLEAPYGLRCFSG